MPIPPEPSSVDALRTRLSHLRVLIADRDKRTATMVRRILFSLGLRHIEMTNDGEHALLLLSSQPFDIIITEWNMHPFDGVEFVKTIRAARDDKRIKRDIPIIMLTARAELDTIAIARDAGINEFIVKPFSAETISGRLLKIIENPRSFIEAPGYAGPCRRRRGAPPPGMQERRAPRGNAPTEAPQNTAPGPAQNPPAEKTPSATAILNSFVVDAPADGAELVAWARREIAALLRTYATLEANPTDTQAQQALYEAAYTLKSQAGLFGYELGSEVASMLLFYLLNHTPPKPNHLRVLGKHVEVMTVIFRHSIEQSGQEIARDLIRSLNALVTKLG